MTRAKIVREHRDCFGYTHPAGTTGRLMGAFGAGAERRVVFKLPVAPEGGSRILTVLERDVEEVVSEAPALAPGAVGDVLSPSVPEQGVPPWLATPEDAHDVRVDYSLSPVSLLLGVGLVGWFLLSVALHVL